MDATIGKYATMSERGFRAVGVGAERILAPRIVRAAGDILGVPTPTPKPPNYQFALERASEAVKPSYKPQPGERIGATLGEYVGSLPKWTLLETAAAPAAIGVQMLTRARSAIVPAAVQTGLASAGSSVLDQMAKQEHIDDLNVAVNGALGAIIGGSIRYFGDRFGIFAAPRAEVRGPGYQNRTPDYQQGTESYPQYEIPQDILPTLTYFKDNPGARPSEAASLMAGSGIDPQVAQERAIMASQVVRVVRAELSEAQKAVLAEAATQELAKATKVPGKPEEKPALEPIQAAEVAPGQAKPLEPIAEAPKQPETTPDAKFIGFQKEQGQPDMPLFNVTKPGHPLLNSTVSLETLEKEGLNVPEIPTAKPVETGSKSVVDQSSFKAEIMDKFNLPEDQAHAVSEITDARAEAWSKTTGKPKEEWFKTRIAGVEKGEAPKPGELEQESSSSPVFYSKLSETIDQKMPNAASPDQVLGLVNNAGVKAEELEWSGLKEFLQEKKSVNKQEVKDFLKANEIEIHEVTKGKREELTKLEKDEMIRLGLEQPWNAKQKARYEELNLKEMGEGIKFETYQLPGGENYREMLFILPSAESTEADALRAEAEKRGYSDKISEWPDREFAERYRAKVTNAPRSKEEFRSGHFPEPNVLAHVRFNDRIGPNGEKILFLEEVQSDWHQKGKKQGYKVGKPADDEKRIQDWLDNREGSDKTIKAKDISLRDLQSWDAPLDIQAAFTSFMHEEVGVPDAPFKKTWHELVLKRMIRYATDNGYDKVAWTTGSQQAERYDLSKQVEKIGWLRQDNGLYTLNIVAKDQGLLPTQVIDAKKLPEVVGKELAQKIIESPEQQGGFHGLDLKVGGEGMRGFYDQIIPAFLNKYAKKWGTRVVKTYLPADRGPEDEIGYVHSLDITPSMKESVSKGQPLFQKSKGSVRFLEDGRAIIRAFESADVSTAIHEIGHVLRRDLEGLDLKVVEEWAGAKEGWTTEAEEKFARGFEKYLQTGEAPTKELAKAFDLMSEWLKEVYLRSKDLANITISEPVRKAFDNLFGKPPAPPKPPPSLGATGGGPEPTDPVQRILLALKNAKPIRGKQEKLYSKEWSRRLAKAIAMGKEVPGEKGFFAQLGSLKGIMQKINFESLRGKLTQEDIDGLFDLIRKSGAVSEFEKITTQTGLLKILGQSGGQVPTRNELSLLRKVFGPEFTNAVLDKRSLLQKFLDLVPELLNVPRTMVASGDMSMPLRQGVFLIRRVGHFAPAFRDMHKFFFSERAYQALDNFIHTHPNYDLAKEHGLALMGIGDSLTNREEQFMAGALAEKIPVIGRLIRASNRAATGFLNKLRFDVFNSMIENAKRQGRDIEDSGLVEAMTDYINTASGRGSIGKLESAAVVMNSVFFSPRLMASRVHLIVPYKYIKADPFVRKEFLKDWFGFVGFAMAVLGLAKFAGAKLESDPTNADWGKAKIGNTRIDPWAGFQQYARLVAQLLYGKITSSTTGVPMTLGEGYKPMTRYDIILRFGESKENPILSFVTAWLRGKNFRGEAFDTPMEIAQRFIPMVYQDIIDLAKDDPKLISIGILSNYGMGVQTYQRGVHDTVQAYRTIKGYRNDLIKSGDTEGARKFLKTNTDKEEILWEGSKLDPFQKTIDKFDKRIKIIQESSLFSGADKAKRVETLLERRDKLQKRADEIFEKLKKNWQEAHP